MSNNLLGKYVVGNADLSEKEQFIDWLEESKENEEVFYETKNLYTKVRAIDELDTLLVPNEFQKLWNLIESNKKNKRIHVLKKIYSTVKYAASILLAITIGWYVSGLISSKKDQFSGSEPSYNYLIADKEQITHAILSDGTEVWLNSGSELKYTDNFSQNSRKVWLSGEAFFHVAHKNAPPFYVNLSNLQIKVLGTEFNVSAYPEDGTVETTLVNGKVRIINKKRNKYMDMEPQQSVSYNYSTNKFTKTWVDTELYSGWKEGKFIFRDEKLLDICKKLERWYNVKITFEKEERKNYRFTGKIRKSPSISYVLKMIKITTELNYEIKENRFSQDEIIIK